MPHDLKKKYLYTEKKEENFKIVHWQVLKPIGFLQGNLELLVAPWSNIKTDKFPLKQWAQGIQCCSMTPL